MIIERCLCLSKALTTESNRALLRSAVQLNKIINVVNQRKLRKAASHPERINPDLHDDAAASVPNFWQRIVPKTPDELEAIKRVPPKSPPDSRVLTVSILGSPNAGKSTLANALMEWRVCSVSKKVHTTTENTKAIMLEGNIQIVILDTPGLVSLQEKWKHKLSSKMVNDPKASIGKADLVIVIVDVSNHWTRNKLHDTILQLLEEHKDKTSILVLNKVDLLKSKSVLLEVTNSLTDGFVNGQPVICGKKRTSPLKMNEIFAKTESLQETKNESDNVAHFKDSSASSPQASNNSSGWPYFKRVFMVSSLEGDGINDIKEYLLSQSKEGRWIHNSSMVTDQKPQEIAIMAVREKLLEYLPEEIPYNLNLVIEMWDVDKYGFLRISMLVQCPLKRHVKLVIGEGGRMIRTISDKARQELMNTFRCELSLKLVVQLCEKKKRNIS